MIIRINENYRIAGKDHCWAIEQRIIRKRKGFTVDEWVAIKWFPALEMSVQRYWDYALRTSDAENFEQALVEIKRISAELCSALSPDIRLTLLDHAPGSEITRAEAGEAQPTQKLDVVD